MRRRKSWWVLAERLGYVPVLRSCCNHLTVLSLGHFFVRDVWTRFKQRWNRNVKFRRWCSVSSHWAVWQKHSAVFSLLLLLAFRCCSPGVSHVAAPSLLNGSKCFEVWKVWVPNESRSGNAGLWVTELRSWPSTCCAILIHTRFCWYFSSNICSLCLFTGWLKWFCRWSRSD